MKNLFKGFHTPTPKAIVDAWSDENTKFVFDTNVLLNLYGYAEQTRNDFFNVLKSLGGKIWLPYHVGLEYQQKRLKVIKNEKAVFNDIEKALQKIDKIFTDDLKKLALERRFPKLHENTKKCHRDISKSITSYKKSVTHWDKAQPCVRSHDSIRDTINELFENNIGSPPPDQDWLNSLYEEGKTRYENKIPPGFEDRDKDKSDEAVFFYNNLKYDRQFGDLILWKQIIEKSKSDNIHNIIFITDDNKEDWWYILNSRGAKQIGPHANLQSEIYRESNINIFHMYNTSTFLNDGKINLEIGIHASSIEDASTQFWEANRKYERIAKNNKEKLKHDELILSDYYSQQTQEKVRKLLKEDMDWHDPTEVKKKQFFNKYINALLSDNIDNNSMATNPKLRKAILKNIREKDISNIDKEYFKNTQLWNLFNYEPDPNDDDE